MFFIDGVQIEGYDLYCQVKGIYNLKGINGWYFEKLRFDEYLNFFVFPQNWEH
jgi:hypothetical protein